MKDKYAVRKRLNSYRTSKNKALKNGSHVAYVAACKIIKVLEWVLGDDIDEPIKERNPLPPVEDIEGLHKLINHERFKLTTKGRWERLLDPKNIKLLSSDYIELAINGVC